MGASFSDPTLYRKIVGSLQYETVTHPYITYVVNRVCEFMHAPSNLHWQAVKRILRYLNGTLSDLNFKLKTTSLLSYFDARYMSNNDKNHHKYGFINFHGFNLISWTSQKKRSYLLLKYWIWVRSLTYTTAELMADLQSPIYHSPMLLCGNVGAIFLSKNLMIRTRSKYISLDVHFIREQVKAGKLKICHVSSINQLADIFTKPLGKQHVVHLRNMHQFRPVIELVER